MDTFDSKLPIFNVAQAAHVAQYSSINAYSDLIRGTDGAQDGADVAHINSVPRVCRVCAT